MKVKRWRQPKQIPNTLRLQWGKLPESTPDIVCTWGEGCHKADCNFLLHKLTGSQMETTYDPSSGIKVMFNKSITQELEARGYDITTLNFSIKKKEVVSEP